MKKILIIGAVIVVVAGIIWMSTNKGPSAPQASKLDAVDTVGSFYSDWLKTTKQPTGANPNKANLIKSPLLSPALQARLAVNPNATPDPVLCQTKVPTDIATRKVYENVDKAQALVTSRDNKVTEEAIINLIKINNSWFIDSIECSAGEFAPDKEFTFENQGFLLKGSIPPPYNNKNWHLIFEENNTAGNVVPLIFDSKSQCNLDGIKAVCKPDQFKETTKVSVHGQMTEKGASVTRMEFVK